MLANQRVFITGAGGFLGQAVCSCLSDCGFEVYRYCLRSRTYDRALSGFAIFGESFRKEELSRALRQADPDFVIHLASAGVISGDNDPSALYEVNVEATRNLVSAMAETGRAKLIHTGSCSEYAPSDSVLLSELSPIGPTNFYGATKSASVQIALGLARQLAIPATVLRPFNIYGPRESRKRLVPYLIEGQLQNQECKLTHGLQQKDFLHVEDAARGYLSAIENFDRLGSYEIYNLCSGIGHTLRDVGSCLAEVSGGRQEIYKWGAVAPRAGEPDRIVGDPSKFRIATGWTPRYHLDIGLRKTFFYHLRLHSESRQDRTRRAA